MALVAEDNQAVIKGSESGTASTTNIASLVVRAFAALGLMLLAGNCFLEYLWWTAKYSALAGIPKVAAQWEAAGARASLYGWSLVLLEIAIVLVLCGLIRLRSIDSSKLRNALRLISSLIITSVGTALLALVLSWIKQAAP